MGTVCSNHVLTICYTQIFSPQGGGGSPYSTYLGCCQILRDGGSMHIVDHKSLKDDDVVARGCKIIKIHIEEMIIQRTFIRLHGISICSIGEISRW